MAVELQQVVAARQSDLGMPRLDGHDAEARRALKPLALIVSASSGGLRAPPVITGMRTGSCSMPRTKLE